MKKENTDKCVLGMIGLGTMGANLLQNIADHGYNCSGYDNDASKVAALNKLGSKNIHGFRKLDEFVQSLQRPRVVMMLVPAGEIVDKVIAELLKVLEKGDIIIDGGNSHYTDTERRYEALEQKEIHFIGMGVSGGEDGARHGPSMMPGGDEEAYNKVAPLLKKIAAHVDGAPTVAYMGLRSAGHFVKMVHNGIEYAIMQLIAETYQLLQLGLGYNDAETHEIFKKWNEGRLQSYLMEITSAIFAFIEEGDSQILLDDISDEAKANGTGKWTTQAAMDLQLATPIIDVAVGVRSLSLYKDLRSQTATLYPDTKKRSYKKDTAYLKNLEQAFYFGMVASYAQGMHLMAQADKEYKYQLNIGTIAKIWRGGCIIRSAFLNDIYDAYQRNADLQHLYLDPSIRASLQESIPHARSIVSNAVLSGIAVPAYAAALGYFDNIRSETMPTNLIQAQRDYFGSHTYERKGKKGVFHTTWVVENTLKNPKQ